MSGHGAPRPDRRDERNMRVAIAGDHAGFQLKQELVAHLRDSGHQVLDLGSHNTQRSDYPDLAKAVGLALQHGEVERGVLICGSGVGASIAANKMRGVRAAICHDYYSAHQGVEHDDMNVLCLGALVVNTEQAKALIDTFLNAQFIGEGRYKDRLGKVLDMEAEMCDDM